MFNTVPKLNLNTVLNLKYIYINIIREMFNAAKLIVKIGYAHNLP